MLLVTFEIFYLTSKQYKQQNHPAHINKIKTNVKAFRWLAIGILIMATGLFILNLGWSSGIIAAFVGLMAAGSLITLLQPFRYLRLTTIGVLYFSVLLLEIFI